MYLVSQNDDIMINADDFIILVPDKEKKDYTITACNYDDSTRIKLGKYESYKRTKEVFKTMVVKIYENASVFILPKE